VTTYNKVMRTYFANIMMNHLAFWFYTTAILNGARETDLVQMFKKVDRKTRMQIIRSRLTVRRTKQFQNIFETVW